MKNKKLTNYTDLINTLENSNHHKCDFRFALTIENYNIYPEYLTRCWKMYFTLLMLESNDSL